MANKTSPGSARSPLWIVGWREWVVLPDLAISQIKAKLDTGARTSALHASDVEPFRQDGKQMVRFVVHPLQRNERKAVPAVVPMIDERRVRSSSGQVERRPVIRTTVQVAERRWEIELTLTNRDQMGFRMLLGREAMRGRLLVDSRASYYAGEPGD